MINATRFWINDTLVPRSPDPHFHLRLIHRFVSGDWALPLFDPLLNYPHGALLYWPPGFDMALSLIIRPFQSWNTTMDTGSLVLGLTVPLMGTIAILFLWLAVRRIGLSPLQATGLLLLAVVSHSLVDATRFGRVDHQALELLSWSAFLWLYIRVLTDTTDRATSISRVLGGLLAASLFFCNGALILIGLINAAFLFSALVEKQLGVLLTRWKTVTLWTLPGALVSVLMTGTFLHFPFSAVYLSMFHVTACAIPFVFVFIWIALNRHHEPVRTKRIMLFLILAAVIILLAVQGNALIDVLLRRDLNAALVPESNGLVTAYRYSILLQPLVFMAPAVIVGLLVQAGKQERRPMTISIAGLLTLSLVLSLLQIRFLPLMETVSLIAIALLMDEISRRAFQAKRWTTATLVVLALIPTLHLMMMRKAEARSFPIMKAILPVCTWLQENTDADSAVLSPVWGYGHYVVCLAERPTVSSAFGATPAFERGIRASLLSAFVTGEDQLVSIMDDTEARILLLPDMSMLRLDYRLAWERSGMDPLPVHDRYELDRLYGWNNGQTATLTGTSSGHRHLRLIYNGPHQVNGKTAFRVFERVPSATITGTVPDPTGSYLATIVLLPSNGTPVLWRLPIDVQPDGSFQTICPYNTAMNGDLKAISKLEIWDLDARKVIGRTTISEADIQYGYILTIQDIQL